MMSMRPSIKIVKVITPRPGSGVRVQGWSLYAHISYILKKIFCYDVNEILYINLEIHDLSDWGTGRS